MLTSTPWRIAAAVLLVRIDVMQRHARTMPGTTPIKVIPISRDRERPVHTGSGPVALGDGGRCGGQNSSSSSMNSVGS